MAALPPVDVRALGRYGSRWLYANRYYLFGSWASGAPHQASDIDIAVDAAEPLPPETLARLREALEESTVPYRVDRREGILWIASASA